MRRCLRTMPSLGVVVAILLGASCTADASTPEPTGIDPTPTASPVTEPPRPTVTEAQFGITPERG